MNARNSHSTSGYYKPGPRRWNDDSGTSRRANVRRSRYAPGAVRAERSGTLAAAFGRGAAVGAVPESAGGDPADCRCGLGASGRRGGGFHHRGHRAAEHRHQLRADLPLPARRRRAPGESNADGHSAARRRMARTPVARRGARRLGSAIGGRLGSGRCTPDRIARPVRPASRAHRRIHARRKGRDRKRSGQRPGRSQSRISRNIGRERHCEGGSGGYRPQYSLRRHCGAAGNAPARNRIRARAAAVWRAYHAHGVFSGAFHFGGEHRITSRPPTVAVVRGRTRSGFNSGISAHDHVRDARQRRGGNGPPERYRQASGIHPEFRQHRRAM